MQELNQKQLIMLHLLRHGSITTLEAIGVHRVFNLKARIHELRKDGHNIETEMRLDDTGKQYARYWLAALRNEVA